MKDTAVDCYRFLKTTVSITVFSTIIGLGISTQSLAQDVSAPSATEIISHSEQMTSPKHLHDQMEKSDAAQKRHDRKEGQNIIVRGACTQHSSALVLKSLSSWVAGIRG